LRDLDDLKIGRKGENMPEEKVKKLSPAKRIGGFLLIIVVGLVSFAIGLMFVRFLRGPSENTEASNVPGLSVLALIFVGGNLSFVAGVLLYFVSLITHCFTFDFDRPIWNVFKKKLYIINIIVGLLVTIGIVFLVSLIVAPMLMLFGLPLTISVTVSFLFFYFVVQLLLVWVDVWTPLQKKIIKKRLSAFGISTEDLDKGIYIGISDPAKSSFKKLSQVEEDIGMMWLIENVLVYKGDSQSFQISRQDLIEIERQTDSGSISAYAGNVHIILRFRKQDGTQQRTRLHYEGSWTLGQTAKASDKLAQLLMAWQKGPLPSM
jgi:hypothetical protein